MNLYNKTSDGTSLPICYSLLPHYATDQYQHDDLLRLVAEALQDARINTFFLSGHSHSHPNISPFDLARDIIAAGGEPIISLGFAYEDRNAILNKLLQYCRIGVRQFLFVTGNYPALESIEPRQPVFDLDSVQFLMLLNELKQSPTHDLSELENIVRGCVVSPFKGLESEQVWQYEKLKRKIEVGADFVITQLGFDIQKLDDLLKFCKLHKITTPLIANVCLLDLATTYLLQEGPGIKIPQRLIDTLQKEDQSQSAVEKKIFRAAKTLAVAKGLGYQGIFLENHSSNFSTVKDTLDAAEELQTNWQDYVDEINYADSSFYYFQNDSSKKLQSSKTPAVIPKKLIHPMYYFSYFVDWLLFVPKGPLFNTMKRFCLFCNGRKFWHSFIWLLEYLAKGPLYRCKMCGDCTLYACGFLCYRSGCPKNLLNGPCGGSNSGYCEVYPNKNICYWNKVYDRMKGIKKHVTFVTPPIPAKDNVLDRTSSWINFFQGRDHRKKIPPNNSK